MATSGNTIQAPIFLTVPQTSGSPSEKDHILKVFPKKSMVVTSSIQITCGAIAALLQVIILGFDDRFPAILGTGIWCGIFFALAGGIGLIVHSRPSSCSVIAYMVLCIIATLFSLIFVIFAGIGFGQCRSYYYNNRDNNCPASRVLHGIQLLIGLTEGVAAIVTSSFCCRVVCCGRQHYPGSVIFSSPENPAATGATSGVEFSTIPLNSVAQSVVASAASNYEKPPEYEATAQPAPATDGEKYQRFA